MTWLLRRLESTWYRRGVLEERGRITDQLRDSAALPAVVASLIISRRTLGTLSEVTGGYDPSHDLEYEQLKDLVTVTCLELVPLITNPN